MLCPEFRQSQGDRRFQPRESVAEHKRLYPTGQKCPKDSAKNGRSDEV